jgi:hypothetical protein
MRIQCSRKRISSLRPTCTPQASIGPNTASICRALAAVIVAFVSQILLGVFLQGFNATLCPDSVINDLLIVVMGHTASGVKTAFDLFGSETAIAGATE